MKSTCYKKSFWLLAGLLWWAFATARLATAATVDENAGPIAPLGAYAQIKATEDHTYGHELRLWHTGNRLLGQLLYWDGNIEAQKGVFTDGDYNARSGEFQFKVTIMRRDVQPNTQTTATFSGRRVKNTVTGRLRWEGAAAQTRGKVGTEILNLPVARDRSIEKYADADAWRKAVVD